VKSQKEEKKPKAAAAPALRELSANGF